VTTSRWLIAAATSMLACGVLVAVGPVAHADDASPASHESTSSHGSGLSGLTSRVSQTVRSTVKGTANVLGVHQLPKSSVGSTAPTAKSPRLIAAASAITRTVTGAIDNSPTAPADPIPDLSPAASTVSNLVTPLNGAIASAAPKLAAPLTDVVSTVAPRVAATIPVAVEALVDVSAATTHTIVTVTQLPSNFAAAFGFESGQPVAPNSLARTLLPQAEKAAAPLQIVRLLSQDPLASGADATPAPIATAPTDLVAALGHASLAATNTRVAHDGATPGGLREFLNSFGGLAAVAVAASLAALAAAALPGVAAMLLSTAAGMRIGYRQAKARGASRISGIARFAAAGPVGIVRSGAVVALRPSKPNAGRIRPGDSVKNVA
jgi:hypothetical protein